LNDPAVRGAAPDILPAAHVRTPVACSRFGDHFYVVKDSALIHTVVARLQHIAGSDWTPAQV